MSEMFVNGEKVGTLRNVTMTITEYNDCPECGAKSEDYHRPFICENCNNFFPELRFRG